MAHKRMFSKDITGSDAFREMPMSSQALYFHLGMDADDDGFLGNYKTLMRSVGASDDDLKILITKRFLIVFETGVIVVKHWLVNNTVRADRYNETLYLEEKSKLSIKENGSYTERNDGIPLGYQRYTQDRIGKDRKEDIIKDIPVGVDTGPGRVSKAKYPDAKKVFALFGSFPGFWKVSNPIQQAAQELYDTKGIDELKEFMDWYKKNRHRDFCPQFDDPLGWIKKYEAISRFFDKVS